MRKINKLKKKIYTDIYTIIMFIKGNNFTTVQNFEKNNFILIQL